MMLITIVTCHVMYSFCSEHMKEQPCYLPYLYFPRFVFPGFTASSHFTYVSNNFQPNVSTR